MTLQLSMRLAADGGNAKAGIASVQAETEKLRSSTATLRAELARNQAELARLAASGQRGGATYKALSADAARLRAELAGVNASVALNATQLRALQTGGQLAAGSMGNLAAQFNDIGLMMAAGQNPLQLALQQGTQISQVIGPLGAAGAVRALGGAFLSVLSPVSLLTVGSIAFGAALVQWLGRGREEARSLDDAVSALDESIKAVRDGAAASLSDLAGEFGQVTSRVLLMQGELQKIRIREIVLDAAAAARSLGDEVDAMGGFLASGAMRLGDAFGLSLGAASQLEQAIRNVGRAETFSEQVAAVGRVQEMLIAAAGSIDNMTDEQAAFYAKTLEVERALRMAAAAAGEIPAGLAAANAQAEGLLGTLIQLRQQEIAAEGLVYSGRGGDPRTSNRQGRGKFVYEGPPLDARNNPIASDRGAAGSKAEADAVGELLARLQSELDILREADPVRRELLRYREALAGATEEERRTVEELIAARAREEQQIATATARADFFNETLAGALDAAIQKGQGLDDVIRNIGRSLLQAAIQGAIFGKGIFGGIFGGQSIGQLLFPVGKADGGRISGPGGPTDDRVPIWASDGEYIVNAAATRRNLHLLEAINAGASLPRYAAGGRVGGGSGGEAGRPGGGGPRQLIVQVSGARGNSEIREMVMEGVGAGLREYDRAILPRSVQRVSGDPRGVG